MDCLTFISGPVFSIGTNIIRVLSIGALIAVFVTQIIALRNNARTVTLFTGSAKSDDDATSSNSTTTCNYLFDTDVPDSWMSPFWSLFARVMLIVQTVPLFLSELCWFSMWFRLWLPVLGPEFGVWFLGGWQLYLGATILTHYYNDDLTSAFLCGWILAVVGFINLALLGLCGKKVKEWRNCTSADGLLNFLPPYLGGPAKAALAGGRAMHSCANDRKDRVANPDVEKGYVQGPTTGDRIAELGGHLPGPAAKFAGFAAKGAGKLYEIRQEKKRAAATTPPAARAEPNPFDDFERSVTPEHQPPQPTAGSTRGQALTRTLYKAAEHSTDFVPDKYAKHVNRAMAVAGPLGTAVGKFDAHRARSKEFRAVGAGASVESMDPKGQGKDDGGRRGREVAFSTKRDSVIP